MKFVRRAFPYFVLAVLAFSGVAFWLKHDEILDWAAARGYQPTATVRGFVSQTTMTPYAERLFYANRPAVQDKKEFNKNCTDPSEEVAVLGCFKGNRAGIYIYDVTDKRLKGIEEVTAAHEMLHQAYQRLGKAEKTRVNGLLQEFHDLQASKDLKDKLANYKSDDPTATLNEMHSIFGTEAAKLPSELERYYAQYFKDRKKVVALYERYQEEFDKRLAKIAEYDKRLESLGAKIESNKATLETRNQQLMQRRAEMDADLNAGRVEEYNAAVAPYNAMVGAYRDLAIATNNLIDEYNDTLAKRNALAVQERELENAINSNVGGAARQ